MYRSSDFGEARFTAQGMNKLNHILPKDIKGLIGRRVMNILLQIDPDSHIFLWLC